MKTLRPWRSTASWSRFRSRSLLSARLTALFLTVLFLVTAPIRAQGRPSVVRVDIPNFQMEAPIDGVFLETFTLEEPISLEGVTYAHWEQMFFEVRQNETTDVPYGGRVDFTLMSAGQEILTPFWTAAVNAGTLPSFAQKIRKGFEVPDLGAVQIDAIRVTMQNPLPFQTGGADSTATIRGLGENNSLTFRFFRSPPDGNENQLFVPGFIEMRQVGPGFSAWQTRMFDDPVSAESLRFVNFDGLGFNAGQGRNPLACGGMLETQLLLDGHSPQVEDVIVMDDAFSPSRGEPCASAISFHCSRELSAEEQESLRDREIIGMRWRVHALQDCTFIVNQLFETGRIHFAYESDSQPPIVPDALFLRGDANADGTVNIADGVATLGFLFAGDEGLPCLDAADTDDSGRININDSIGTFNWLFQAGAAPAPPGPQECGEDPTEDDLGCTNPPNCH